MLQPFPVPVWGRGRGPGLLPARRGSVQAGRPLEAGGGDALQDGRHLQEAGRPRGGRQALWGGGQLLQEMFSHGGSGFLSQGNCLYLIEPPLGL